MQHADKTWPFQDSASQASKKGLFFVLAANDQIFLLKINTDHKRSSAIL